MHQVSSDMQSVKRKRVVEAVERTGDTTNVAVANNNNNIDPRFKTPNPEKRIKSDGGGGSGSGHGRNPFAQLPGDIIASILLKLPMCSLYIARRVCKSWLSIISESSFALSYRAQYPPVLGFLPAKEWYQFIPSASSSPDERSIISSHSDEFTNAISVESTCNGNLLCWRSSTKDYCIFNPVTKQAITIPRPFNSIGNDSLGFISNADSSRYLIVGLQPPWHGQKRLNARTYSCVTKVWRTTTTPMPRTAPDHHANYSRYCKWHPKKMGPDKGNYLKPVTIGDMIYWRCCDLHVLAYDSKRSLQEQPFSFLNTPKLEREPSPWIDVLLPDMTKLMSAEGRLRFTFLRRNKLRIWVLQGNHNAADNTGVDSSTWLLEHCISIEKMFEGNEHLLRRDLTTCPRLYEPLILRMYPPEDDRDVFRLIKRISPLGFDAMDRHLLFLSVKFQEYMVFVSFHLRTRQLKRVWALDGAEMPGAYIFPYQITTLNMRSIIDG